MKVNLPVSGCAVQFSANANILSTTNPKGAITYVNPDFISISGFSEAELLGVNHNIVRHPDMPPEAFTHLWQTLKAGRSWMGLVKNRCKNGDHYWVSAYVTPMQRNGEIVEYQSVRTLPPKALVDAAEHLYAQLRNGKKTHCLRPSRLSVGMGLALTSTGLNLLGLPPWACLASSPGIMQPSLRRYSAYCLAACCITACALSTCLPEKLKVSLIIRSAKCYTAAAATNLDKSISRCKCSKLRRGQSSVALPTRPVS